MDKIFYLAAILGLVVGMLFFGSCDSSHATSVAPLDKYQVRFCINNGDGDICMTSDWMKFPNAPETCKEAIRNLK